MRIEHIAIWVNNLELTRLFYTTYFGGVPGDLYENPKKQSKSYFLRFETGARLELMYRPDIPARQHLHEIMGLTHLAFSVGSELIVDMLTERLRADGYSIVGEPRRTGDGYYESVVLDPEGNRVEITV